MEETWRNLRPSDQVEKVDLLDFVPKLQRQAYAKGFLMLVAHAPELWSLVFKKTDHPALLRKLTRFRRGLARHTNRAFFRHLQAFQPDVVL